MRGGSKLWLEIGKKAGRLRGDARKLEAVMAGLILALLLGGYEIRGQLLPGARAEVALHGSITPFHTSTVSDSEGRFRFKNIAAGMYTVIVFVPGRGENRVTIDVGPSVADAKNRVMVAIKLDEAKMTPDRSSVVTVKQLSVPDKARREYNMAERRLAERDASGATAALLRAVAIAPQFTSAWNFLGTIAYQTRQYPDAEKYFRKALETDATAFEPIVNLGGVLLTVNRPDEAYDYNLRAVLQKPHDALANAQMGLNYFMLGKTDLAEKYLLEARKLDPGHFSHPQLTLAEIYLRRGDARRAADQLEDFVRHHPDWPGAERIREEITRLRKAAPRPPDKGERKSSFSPERSARNADAGQVPRRRSDGVHPARGHTRLTTWDHARGNGARKA